MKYMPEVLDVIENTGPRNTIGWTFTEVRMFLGRKMQTTYEVTAFEPNVKWAYKVTKGPVFYGRTTTFEASNGGMKYTTNVTGEPKGFFKLAEGLVASQLEKTMLESFQRLKDYLVKAEPALSGG
jgi:Polyketide cyclase / dehydrase and lipid transport